MVHSCNITCSALQCSGAYVQTDGQVGELVLIDGWRRRILELGPRPDRDLAARQVKWTDWSDDCQDSHANMCSSTHGLRSSLAPMWNDTEESARLDHNQRGARTVIWLPTLSAPHRIRSWARAGRGRSSARLYPPLHHEEVAGCQTQVAHPKVTHLHVAGDPCFCSNYECMHCTVGAGLFGFKSEARNKRAKTLATAWLKGFGNRRTSVRTSQHAVFDWVEGHVRDTVFKYWMIPCWMTCNDLFKNAKKFDAGKRLFLLIQVLICWLTDWLTDLLSNSDMCRG